MHWKVDHFRLKETESGREGSSSAKEKVYMAVLYLFVFTLQVQYKRYSTGFVDDFGWRILMQLAAVKTS